MTTAPVDVAPAAIRLGYLATVPFVVGAALVWIVDASSRPLVAHALSAYAAVVVSFIGAIHWGIAFTQPRAPTRALVWGVIPSIVAWLALLVALPLGLAAHAVMLAVCYGVDRATYPAAGVARWLPLRLRLTVVAILCCVVGAAGS